MAKEDWPRPESTPESDLEQLKRVTLILAVNEGYIDPKSNRPFILACERCGVPFKDGEKVELMLKHAQDEHGKEDVRLDMIWLGAGPKPKEGSGKRTTIRRRR